MVGYADISKRMRLRPSPQGNAKIRLNEPSSWNILWLVGGYCGFGGAIPQPGSDCRPRFRCFFNSLSQDFHAGRAAVSLAYTLNNIIVALFTPLLGRLIDGVGARRVILIGTAIFGLILLSSVMVGSRLIFLYIFFAALGLVGGTISPVPYGVVVSHWFDRRRGLALGLIAGGLALGGIFVPFLAQRLIAMFGWRTAYATFGGAALLISLPVVAAGLLDDPKQKGLKPDGSVLGQTPQQDEKRNRSVTRD